MSILKAIFSLPWFSGKREDESASSKLFLEAEFAQAMPALHRWERAYNLYQELKKIQASEKKYWKQTAQLVRDILDRESVVVSGHMEFDGELLPVYLITRVEWRQYNASYRPGGNLYEVFRILFLEVWQEAPESARLLAGLQALHNTFVERGISEK